MAELTYTEKFSSSSQDLHCVINEEMNIRPWKGRLWSEKCCFVLMGGTIIIVMALLTAVSITLNQQYSKMTEVENKVVSLASSFALLSSNQQEMKQLYGKLTEVGNEVANLTSGFALLSSDQQERNDRLMEMVNELKADLETRIANLTQYKPVLRCKAGWQHFLSNCYLMPSTKLTWPKARLYCNGIDSLLLILGNDSREWDYFMQYAILTSESYWIGLTDLITSQWRWIDGKPYVMNSSHWEPGEPNDVLNKEDCGELTASGKLNDAQCSKSFQFICKTPATEN
nr:C-type lectin domain family 4 member K-like [Danio rerio]|eukprot:XP_021332242.1 C-type lectin domain family 4 member K-like [Danio rerio]